MTEELKPCPFCEGNRICVDIGIYAGKSHESVTIKCDDCGASIWGATEERAIAAWNRRDALKGLIDELRAEVGSSHLNRDLWHDRAEHMRDRLSVAQAENAKLRELVRIAIEYCVNGYCAEEDECPLYESRHSCRLYAEARELGVDA